MALYLYKNGTELFIELSVDLKHEYRLTIDPETYDSSWSVTNGGTLQNGFFIYKDGNSIISLGNIKFGENSQILEGNTQGRTTKIYRITSPGMLTQLFGDVSGNKQILPTGTLVTTDNGKVYRKLEPVQSYNGTPNRVTTPSLCYYQNNAINYLPLITKTGTLIIGSKIWSYTTSIPTFHVIYNNTEYVVPNKYEEISYDIAPGTYTPSAFENLIKSFISQNGSRAVSNSFSVEVNGETYNVSANSSIYYTYQYSGEARFVSFSGMPRGWVGFEQHGVFAEYGIYCTYWSRTESQGDRYYQYSIKVNTGINFK